MNRKRAQFITVFVNLLLIIIAFLIRYSGSRFLCIGNATPLFLIPITLSIAIFYGENAGLFSGLLAGVLMDSSDSAVTCYNTFFFIIACSLCAVLASRVLNKNIKAALCLSGGMSFGYYILKYIIFYSFSGISVEYGYFTSYLVPSALYTALLLIPFYFLQKNLSNLT